MHDGKMHKLPFRTRSNRLQTVWDFINTDFNGPMTIASLSGARYYVCFKDDYSKLRKLFFLKHKSEVCAALK